MLNNKKDKFNYANRKSLNVAIFGASGAIGKAFVNYFLEQQTVNNIFAFSRAKTNFDHEKVKEFHLDYDDENSLLEARNSIRENIVFDRIIITSGILHEDNILPEKSLRDLSIENFQRLFLINAIFPALIAKHFIPLMNKKEKSVFAIISAKVGSISDNYLGGWYAYRASKAAVNMIVRNISIEVQRKSNKIIVVSMHPGTVDSKLSKPFQSNIDKSKLFSPKYSVEKMLKVIDHLDITQSGKLWSWNGKEIKP